MTQPIDVPVLPEGSANEHASGLEYVGFRRRLAARLIDFIVHFAVGVMAGAFVAILAVAVEQITGRSAQLAIVRLGEGGVVGFLLSATGALLYDAVMEGLHGSTLGKLLVGITVLDARTARPCTFPAAIIRSLAFYWDSLFFGLVGEFSMRSSEAQQRYGDRWAQTVVVRRRSAPLSSIRSGARFALVLVVAVLLDGVVIAGQALMALAG